MKTIFTTLLILNFFNLSSFADEDKETYYGSAAVVGGLATVVRLSPDYKKLSNEIDDLNKIIAKEKASLKLKENGHISPPKRKKIMAKYDITEEDINDASKKDLRSIKRIVKNEKRYLLPDRFIRGLTVNGGFLMASGLILASVVTYTPYEESESMINDEDSAREGKVVERASSNIVKASSGSSVSKR